jgi:hypothetical protein
MTAERQMDRVLGPLLEELAAPHVPDYFDEMMAHVVRAPQRRARWWPGITVRPSEHRGAFGRAVQLVPALLLIGLLLALVWAAAIGRELMSRPAPLEQLMSEPWRDAPMTASAEALAAIDDYCLDQLDTIPGSKTRELVDIRGGYQAHAIYTHDQGYSTCDLQLRQDGTLDGSYTLPAEGPVATRNPMLGVEAPPRYGLTGGSGDERVFGESVGGRISPRVAEVDIVLTDGRRIQASVGGGFYFGWWPEKPPGDAMSRPVPVDRVEGIDAGGRVLTGVNGWLLPEFQDTP